VIADGKRGTCRARINVGGQLRTLVYGRPITIHVDPIEKKPFYHFLPGRDAFSLATSGCPLRCKFCQNWQISQARPEDYRSNFMSPERVVAQAEYRRSPVIAYTYNEPTVFTEYLTDIARKARPQGVRSVLISCGFMTAEPLKEMCEVLDGIKIDLKGFSKAFYRDVCGAELKPVLRSIQQVARSKTHLEIVNLVVPTLNDSDAMLKDLARWVAGEVGPDVPVHFTRFHPDYKMRHLPPTPTATLERARAIARDRGIRYAFVGNLPGHPGNHTYCPGCNKILIERRGFFVESNHIRKGRCRYCQEKIAGVWS
jgi:pyruvate formate lyase activating enzyme